MKKVFDMGRSFGTTVMNVSFTRGFDPWRYGLQPNEVEILDKLKVAIAETKVEEGDQLVVEIGPSSGLRDRVDRPARPHTPIGKRKITP